MYHPDSAGTKETNDEQRGKVFRTDLMMMINLPSQF